MRGGANWLIVALLALNVGAWGSELLLGDGGRPAVVLARGSEVQDGGPSPDPGLRAPIRMHGESAIELPSAPAARARDGRESGIREAPARYHDWVAALADDHVRYNASDALDDLEKCDDRVVPLLRAALESSDRQQRQLAGGLLRVRGDAPTERLLDVTLEALQIDHEWNGGHRTCRYAQNGGHAANYLLQHLPAVTDRLIANLDSGDPQERFLSAYVLGRGGVARNVARTCAILIEHLGDNRLHGDARMSADALHALGALAGPYLVFAEPRADDQALGLLRLLQYDAAPYPDTAAGRHERYELHPAASRLYEPGNPGRPEWLVRHNTWDDWDTHWRGR